MWFFFGILLDQVTGLPLGDIEAIIILPIFLAISYFAQKRFPNVFKTTRKNNKSELTRKQIIDLPIFPGSVDRRKGIIQATARNVTTDSISNPEALKHKKGGIISIIRLRAELLDDVGNHIDYISVEIKGESIKWVGTVIDGDRIRVQGKFGKDGVLHSHVGFNYSTNSYFGETYR